MKDGKSFGFLNSEIFFEKICKKFSAVFLKFLTKISTELLKKIFTCQY